MTNNYISYFEDELKILELKKDISHIKQDLPLIYEIFEEFAEQGHSGVSAVYSISKFCNLISFVKPFTVENINNYFDENKLCRIEQSDNESVDFDNIQNIIDNDIYKLLFMFTKYPNTVNDCIRFNRIFYIIFRCMNFNPLSPLTGIDEEWSCVSNKTNRECWQNNRASSVFKDYILKYNRLLVHDQNGQFV